MRKNYNVRLVSFFFLVGAPLVAQMDQLNPIQPTNSQLDTPKIRIQLTNFNPFINKWFLLKTQTRGKNAETKVFHLENLDRLNRLSLDSKGIAIKSATSGKRNACPLWGESSFQIHEFDFKTSNNPYFSLCQGNLYLRLARESDTKLSLTEWTTQILRQKSWGESLISMVKPIVVRFRSESAQSTQLPRIHQPVFKPVPISSVLLEARMDQNMVDLVSSTNNLGFSLAKGTPKLLSYGKWYATQMHQGIRVSLFTPGMVAPAIFKTYKKRVWPLQKEELENMVYLTAYDLSKYTVNYVMGTQHPDVNLARSNNTAGQENLNAIGSIPPYQMMASIGVFVGGFKSRHGYFKSGPHKGKKYGYIQNGVVLSPMRSGLATIYADIDGHVNIIKWATDQRFQRRLYHTIISARQNGVLLIENEKPSKFVRRWSQGNWSGDVKGRFITMRSAVCIQESSHQRHLIFAAFMAATPSAMARVLQAYSCKVAMQLDMNAHMYMHNALFKFSPPSKQPTVEYLHTEMEYPKGIKRHRFILDNNNRDFFYLIKKPAALPVAQGNAITSN